MSRSSCHPGSVLSEQSLAQRLETGRTPVREALQRLCRDGLVLILPRRGILVSEINPGTQLRLLEVRRQIERLVAGAAASRATEPQARAFSAVSRGMLEAARKADGLAFMRLDRELNVLVCEAGKNEFAARAMSLMHGLSRRFWYQHYRDAADLPFAARLHADLADAISRRRPDEAAAASDRLLDYIEEFTRKTVDG